MSVSDVQLKYLEFSIMSILNQTYSKFEFIIVIDTKNEKIISLINKYKIHDKRINIIQNNIKIGLAKSLNKAIEISKSEYIARQDADDISLTNRLEKQVYFLESNKNISVLGSYVYKIDETNKIIGKISRKIKSNNSFYYENLLIHPSTMFIKKHFIKIGKYNENLDVSQDYELWVKFSKKYKIFIYPEYLFKLRIHKKSISSIYKDKQYLYSFFIGLCILDDNFFKIFNDKNFKIFSNIKFEFFLNEFPEYSEKILSRKLVLLNDFSVLNFNNLLNIKFLFEIIKFYYFRPKLLFRNILNFKR